ncbi:helix-turn-helix transcriptional regulator [Alteromonas macleodii]|uniref:helix-turn-helix transcriptional regulator n=1 Tax=Alteromonas macleodii TaxID=28108 RepID=UPI001E5A37FA|nr:helix-turn-helix transcriptional regulator [Alteromonas macleodii]
MQLGQRFRHAYSEVTYWNSYITGDVAVIRRQSFVPLEMSDREHCLYAVSFMYRLYKKFHGENARVIGISLIQPSEADNSIDSFFECPISYGQDFDGFTLHIDDYYKPNKSFCVKTYQTLLSKLANHHVFFPETRLFSTTVKSLIAQTLSTGEITLHDVANMVGISSSAVKKRLKKENCTFSDLLIDVRLNVAKRLLIQPDIPLTNIAAMLGYSEASSFSRAFNALEQQSPREWRKKNIP